MSSARNVHFERARALGSLNARPFGALGGNMSQRQALLLGAALVYGGLGFPGLSEAGKSIQNILKYQKRAAAENIAIAGGVVLMLGAMRR